MNRYYLGWINDRSKKLLGNVYFVVVRTLF